MRAMDIDAYRRARLKELIDREAPGNVAQFARLHDEVVSATRLRQLLNPNYRGGEGFKEGAARNLEEALGLPPLYFDLGIEEAISGKHGSSPTDASISAPNTGETVKLPGTHGASMGLSNTEPGPDIKGKYPLISWVQAGAWETIVDNFAPGDAEEWLAAPARVSQASYYLRVRGESMYDPADHRSFHEGEKVLVDPNADAEHGSFVVVRLDDESEATFKQLIIEGGKKYLKALNPNWPNRIFEVNGNATICGVVKGKFVDGY